MNQKIGSRTNTVLFVQKILLTDSRNGLGSITLQYSETIQNATFLVQDFRNLLISKKIYRIFLQEPWSDQNEDQASIDSSSIDVPLAKAVTL